MLSSGAVRAQVSSIIEALSKAAVGEILKVFEDGMVLLRLEVCQRDSEIKKLKRNVEVLHQELRSVQGGGSLQPDPRGDGEDSHHLLLQDTGVRPGHGGGAHKWLHAVLLD